ncbi:MAG: hypothetical protein ABIS18_02415 [Actinomycetota bacterium]
MKHVGRSLVAVFIPIVILVGALPSGANHAWGPYHWARTSNPFTLTVVDSVTSNWDSYLNTANADWTASSVLDLTKVQGDEGSVSRKKCNPISGKIRVCNQTYGLNGWLGVANIWLTTGNHIAQGTTKLNDSYFNTTTYNKPEWRQFVTCQEIGHDFGLDHQDTIFDNPNLGSCMDYTDFPLGPPDNTHPNQHDYDQLVSMYNHSDSFNSFSLASPASIGAALNLDEGITVGDDRAPVGVYVSKDGIYTVVTFIYWA